MGLFESFRPKKSHEYRQALEAAKERTQKEGEAMRDRMHAETETRRAAINAETEKLRQAKDDELAAHRKEHDERWRQHAIDTVFMRLSTGVSSKLKMSLARQGSADAAAMENLKADIDERVNALKAIPSEASIESFQNWALSRADERHHASISHAFANFRENLIEQGITFAQ